MRKGFELSSENTKVPDGLNTTGKPYRVLCVDDSKFILKQLTQILVSESYEVCGTANDGEEAIELCKELKPDLVILDIIMPDINGVDVVKALIDFDPTAKIVMCSALGYYNLIKDSLDAGAKDYVKKPFRATQVVEVVKKVLDE